MLVKFYDRTPVTQRELGNAKMDSVPREGDNVVINDKLMNVHSVT